MKFRKIAMGRGISVEMSRIQDPVPKQDKYLSNTGQPLDPVLSIMAYKLARPRQKELRLNPRIDWILSRTGKNSQELPLTWEWGDGKPELMSEKFLSLLQQALGDLPDDVVKIQELNQVLTVFWHERSGEKGLTLVAEFLERCTALSPGGRAADSEPD
jgi:hypothetical protein